MRELIDQFDYGDTVDPSPGPDDKVHAMVISLYESTPLLS